MVAGDELPADPPPDGVRSAGGVAWREAEDFQRQLQLPVGISWAEMPLRQGLSGLADNQRVAIWLDRRLDPNRLLGFSASGVSLRTALQQLAARLNVAVGSVGDVVYFGPKPVAERLATIAALKRDAVEKMPSSVRSQWQRRQPFRWEVLTSPRELLEAIASEFNIDGKPLRIVEAERLPHDLWAEGNYPPMPPTDRLTLLLAGFDLSFDLARDGSAIRLAPLPESVELTRAFSADNPLRAEQQVAREFPQVKLRRRGSRLVATGRYEDLELIRRLLRGERVAQAPTVAGAEVRFDLKVDNTEVGAIIAALRKQRQLTVKIDPAVSEKLNTLVSFNLRQVTLEALLKTALQPAGIAFRLNGKVLELFPAAPEGSSRK